MNPTDFCIGAMLVVSFVFGSFMRFVVGRFSAFAADGRIFGPLPFQTGAPFGAARPVRHAAGPVASGDHGLLRRMDEQFLLLPGKHMRDLQPDARSRAFAASQERRHRSAPRLLAMNTAAPAMPHRSPSNRSRLPVHLRGRGCFLHAKAVMSRPSLSLLSSPAFTRLRSSPQRLSMSFWRRSAGHAPDVTSGPVTAQHQHSFPERGWPEHLETPSSQPASPEDHLPRECFQGPEPVRLRIHRLCGKIFPTIARKIASSLNAHIAGGNMSKSDNSTNTKATVIDRRGFLTA